MLILTRWMAVFALLAATFNPTQYNCVACADIYGKQNLSAAVLFGFVLLIGYIVFLKATFRMIGIAGMASVLAVFGAMLWVLDDFGVLSLEDRNLNLWLGLFAL